MLGKEAIQFNLTSTQNMLGMFIADLSDEDLLVQPAPGANHIAWQLGHLCSSEGHLLGKLLPGVVYPDLPQAITNQPKGNTGETKGFLTKAEYMSLLKQVRKVTLAALAQLSDADLDKPNAGELASFAPTLGALFILVGNHTLMHAGQFSVVRRKLGKPVLF